MNRFEWKIYDRENMEQYDEDLDHPNFNHDMGGDLEEICSNHLETVYQLKDWGDEDSEDRYVALWEGDDFLEGDWEIEQLEEGDTGAKETKNTETVFTNFDIQVFKKYTKQLTEKKS